MREIDSRQDLIIHLADLDEPYVLKLVQQILNRGKMDLRDGEMRQGVDITRGIYADHW
jgi:hypothetical protein